MIEGRWRSTVCQTNGSTMFLKCHGSIEIWRGRLRQFRYNIVSKNWKKKNYYEVLKSFLSIALFERTCGLLLEIRRLSWFYVSRWFFFNLLRPTVILIYNWIPTFYLYNIYENCQLYERLNRLPMYVFHGYNYLPNTTTIIYFSLYYKKKKLTYN